MKILPWTVDKGLNQAVDLCMIANAGVYITTLLIRYSTVMGLSFSTTNLPAPTNTPFSSALSFSSPVSKVKWTTECSCVSDLPLPHNTNKNIRGDGED